MNASGYEWGKHGSVEHCHRLEEVTIAGTLEELRGLATFLDQFVTAWEKHGVDGKSAVAEHAHLQDEWHGWRDGMADVVIIPTPTR